MSIWEESGRIVEGCGSEYTGTTGGRRRSEAGPATMTSRAYGDVRRIKVWWK